MPLFSFQNWDLVSKMDTYLSITFTIPMCYPSFNKIYDIGSIPERWLASTFITLPKKPNAKSCEDFRTKILSKFEENNGETNSGSERYWGNAGSIVCSPGLGSAMQRRKLRRIMCFLDYTKAFDRFQHGKMMEMLTDIGLDGKDIRIIANLYWGQKATVRVENRQTEYINIKRGIRQNCILSPLLFNRYSDSFFKEALKNTNRGIRVNGEIIINNIRYADDTVLLSDSIEGLQELLDRVNH